MTWKPPDDGYVHQFIGTANSGRPIILDTEIEVDWGPRPDTQDDEVRRMNTRAVLEAVGLLAALIGVILIAVL